MRPTKVAGTLRRAVRWWTFAVIPGERHMECAYYYDFCRASAKGPAAFGSLARSATFTPCFRVADVRVSVDSALIGFRAGSLMFKHGGNKGSPTGLMACA